MPRDLAKLQGAWRLATLVMDGSDMPAAGTLEIDGDRFRALGMGSDYAGTVEVNDGVKPKEIDLIFTEGPEAGNRNRGIYELKGGRLRLCLNFLGKARPAAFTAEQGSGNALEVFERGAAAPAEDVATEAVGEGELAGEWEMVAAFQEGEALDPRMVKTGRRITTGDRTTTYFGKQVFLNATYTADATGSPKTIDLDNRGKLQLGIYDVEGDTHRICFGRPGGPRPTDFETRPGDGRTSAVWRRVKGRSAKAS